MRAWNEKTRSQIIPWERGRRTKRPLCRFHSRVIHLWVYVAEPIHTYTYVCAYLNSMEQVVVMRTKNGNVPCKSTPEVYRVCLFGLTVGYYFIFFFTLNRRRRVCQWDFFSETNGIGYSALNSDGSNMKTLSLPARSVNRRKKILITTYSFFVRGRGQP